MNKMLSTILKNKAHFACFLLIIINFSGIKSQMTMQMGSSSTDYSATPFNDNSLKFTWSIDEAAQKITLNLDAETTGWVGIGFSKDGMMSGSDMIMCFIDKNSQAQCSDRYSSDRKTPQLDSNLNGKSNLEKVSGSLVNGRSTFSVTRLLNTSDSFDYNIEQGKEIYVLFSYRNKGNPDNENGAFLQHSKYTGAKLVLYPNKNQSTGNKNFLADTSVKKLKLGFDKYPVSSNQTSYICQNYDIEASSNDITGLAKGTTYHAMAYEPIVDKAEYVHHIVIFSCNRDVPITNSPYVCPAFVNECPKIHFEWAPGSGIYSLPSEVGILWGVAENRKIIVQIHYNNPEAKVTNALDSSYVNVYFTTKLRRFDAATSINGVQENFINIPARTAGFQISDECGSACTSRITDSIYIFSAFLHGHMSLKKIRTDIVYANGTIDNTSLREDNFKFDNQKYVYLNTPIKISPGDSLKTYCEYDTSNLDKPVKGGEASTDEMCFAFINFYPRERGPFICIGRVPPIFGCIFYDPYNRTDNTVLLNSGSYLARENLFSSNSVFGVLFIIMLLLF